MNGGQSPPIPPPNGIPPPFLPPNELLYNLRKLSPPSTMPNINSNNIINSNSNSNGNSNNSSNLNLMQKRKLSLPILSAHHPAQHQQHHQQQYPNTHKEGAGRGFGHPPHPQHINGNGIHNNNGIPRNMSCSFPNALPSIPAGVSPVTTTPNSYSNGFNNNTNQNNHNPNNNNNKNIQNNSNNNN